MEKKEAVRVELISKGQFYPEPFNFSTVSMVEMDTGHQDILASELNIQKNIQFDLLLRELILFPPEWSSKQRTEYIDTLFTGDRIYLLLAARINGYGELYEAAATCPQCGHEKHLIDLTQLETNEVSIKSVSEGQNVFRFELEERETKSIEKTHGFSVRHIDFKFLSTQETRKYANEVLRRKREQQDENPITTRLAFSIVGVEGQTMENYSERFKFVKKLKPFITRRLLQYINNNEPMVKSNYDFICANCKNNFKADFGLEIVQLFFDFA